MKKTNQAIQAIEDYRRKNEATREWRLAVAWLCLVVGLVFIGVAASSQFSSVLN